jgi:hypothetical protein
MTAGVVFRLAARSSIRCNAAEFQRLSRLEAIGAARVRLRGASSVVIGLQDQVRNREPMTLGIDRHEREVSETGQLSPTRKRFFRKHLDFNFKRGGPGRGDARPENDEVTDTDRVKELQAIDRGRHQHAAGVAVRRDRSGDVDQVHDGSAEDESEWIRIVRKNDLYHFGQGFRWPFAWQNFAHCDVLYVNGAIRQKPAAENADC